MRWVVALLVALSATAGASGAVEPWDAELSGSAIPIDLKSARPFPGSIVPAGVPFGIRFYVNTGGDDESSNATLREGRVTIELPAAVRVLDQPREIPPIGKTSSCLVDCPVSIPPGTTATGWLLVLVAPQPGVVRIRGTIVGTNRPDPDVSNNSVAFDVRIGEAAALGQAVFVPSRPRAGRLVSLVVPVTVGGAPAAPTSVRCVASVGGVALTGTPLRSPGRATCRYRPPTSAAGRLLRAKVVVGVGATTAVATSGVRLG